MSGREVDVGGEGPILKYIRTKLESEFLTSRVVYITLRSEARKCSRALERMVLCVVLAVGPLLPPVVHLAST